MGALSDLLTEHCPFVCADRSVHVRMESQLRYIIMCCITVFVSLHLQVVVYAVMAGPYTHWQHVCEQMVRMSMSSPVDANEQVYALTSCGWLYKTDSTVVDNKSKVVHEL